MQGQQEGGYRQKNKTDRLVSEGQDNGFCFLSQLITFSITAALIVSDKALQEIISLRLKLDCKLRALTLTMQNQSRSKTHHQEDAWPATNTHKQTARGWPAGFGFRYTQRWRAWAKYTKLSWNQQRWHLVSCANNNNLLSYEQIVEKLVWAPDRFQQCPPQLSSSVWLDFNMETYCRGTGKVTQ